jgi:hypothetical protein
LSREADVKKNCKPHGVLAHRGYKTKNTKHDSATPRGYKTKNTNTRLGYASRLQNQIATRLRLSGSQIGNRKSTIGNGPALIAFS